MELSIPGFPGHVGHLFKAHPRVCQPQIWQSDPGVKLHVAVSTDWVRLDENINVCNSNIIC